MVSAGCDGCDAVEALGRLVLPIIAIGSPANDRAIVLEGQLLAFAHGNGDDIGQTFHNISSAVQRAAPLDNGAIAFKAAL